MAKGKRRYRSRIQIAADILEIAKNGSRKTRIMYLGNLSFDLLQKYLDMLVDYNLIALHDSPERTYFATDKGQRFLKDYHELQKYSGMAGLKKRVLESSLSLGA